jgi:hypothetical protein
MFFFGCSCKLQLMSMMYGQQKHTCIQCQLKVYFLGKNCLKMKSYYVRLFSFSVALAAPNIRFGRILVRKRFRSITSLDLQLVSKGCLFPACTRIFEHMQASAKLRNICSSCLKYVYIRSRIRAYKSKSIGLVDS